MVTCYDYWSAKIIAATHIDSILVGDSAAMVVHGHTSTLPATTEMMTQHTSAVAKGAPDKLIIADMPFLSFRKGKSEALHCVEKLMQAGAHAVKLEGVYGHEETIHHIIESGVPVLGHLGLTPQSIHQLGGFRLQAKEMSEVDILMNQAKKLEELGCFGIVLECIPKSAAEKISQMTSIPIIGIGAGPQVDGQVLVLQDLLGMNPDFQPKFLKKYLNGYALIQESLNHFHKEIIENIFPSDKESYL